MEEYISGGMQIDSWTILNDIVALKKVDKSAFKHHGTGIPQEIRKHFRIQSLKSGDMMWFSMFHGKNRFDAYFQLSGDDRTRLFWHMDFVNLLKENLTDSYNLLINDVEHEPNQIGYIRFEKREVEYLYKDFFYFSYNVDFINPIIIHKDIDNEVGNFNDEKAIERTEGKPSYGATVKYERNPKNRRDCIAYHGCKCAICTFDFEARYGMKGRGFIEVHHLKPLFFYKETVINPITDMIPVCSNCHRMIHRDKNSTLTVEEMKQILRV